MFKRFLALFFISFFLAQPLLGLAAPDPRFTGKELDPTGLNYYGQRYYNNNQGRFTQVDPVLRNLNNSDKLQEILVNPQRLNSYNYGLNNPIKMKDEDGEFAGQFGRDLASGQRDISGFLQKAGEYNITQESFFNKVSGFVTNTIGDFVSNMANVFDPDAKLVRRGLSLAMVAVDVGTGGEGKAVKAFDAVAQQSKMLKGVVNSKAINTIKAVFKESDTISGGTMGALRSEILTGLKTVNKWHVDKARNTIKRIENIFNKEVLNKIEISRLQGIKNSLESLIKNIKL